MIASRTVTDGELGISTGCGVLSEFRSWILCTLCLLFWVPGVLAQTPDLVIQGISFSPASVSPGGSVVVSWTVKNQGSGAASASTTVVRITSSSSSAAGTNLAQVSTGSLAAGQSVAQSATVTAPSTAGTYYVWVIADNYSTSGQTSAAAGNDITLAPGTLTVSGGSGGPVLTSVTPNQISQGNGYQNVTLTGSGFTASSYHQFSVDGGSSWSWATAAPVYNSPTSLTVAVNDTVARTIWIRVCAAYGSSQCSGSVTVTVTATTAPVVSSIAPTTMPADGVSRTLTIYGSNFQSGNIVQFRWGVGAGAGVWNTGLGNPPNILSSTQMTIIMNPGTVTDTIYVRVCRSASQTGSGDCSSGTHSVTVTASTAPVLTSVTPNQISQGNGYQNVTLTGSGFTASSYHQFSVDGGSSWSWATAAPVYNSATSLTVAVNNTVARTIWIRVCAAYGSSQCSGSVTVTVTATGSGAADLLPVPGSLVVSPNPVQVGQTLGFSFTVRNAGSGAATITTTTRVRLSASSSAPSPSDPLLASLATPPLAAGASVPLNGSGTVPDSLAPGVYYIWVTVDALAQLASENRTNNDFGVSITVLPRTEQRPSAFTLNTPTVLCDVNRQIPVVQLTWSASANATSYEIYRDGSPVANIPATLLFYYDFTDVRSGRSYTYVVRARNASGTTDSNIGSVAVPTDTCSPNQAPGSFLLSNDPPRCDYTPPVGPAVLLRWGAAKGASSYEVYRDGSKIYPLSGVFTGTTFEDVSGLQPGQLYRYLVRAINSYGFTESNSLPVWVPQNTCQTSGPPRAFTLTARAGCTTGTPSGQAVYLRWSPSGDAEQYDVLRDNIVIRRALPATVDQFVDTTDIIAGRSYTYVVRARNIWGTIDSPVTTIRADAFCTAPPVPQASAQPGCRGTAPFVQISWSESAGAEGYEIYRDGYLVAGSLPLANRSWTDGDSLVPGRRYTYAVGARNRFGLARSGDVTAVISNCESGVSGKGADLALVASFDPQVVERLSDVVLNVAVYNNGPGISRNVGLVVPVPPGSTLRNVKSVGVGNVDVKSGTLVTFKLGDLGPGEMRETSLTFLVNDNARKQLETHITVGSSTSDDQPTNNSAYAVARILPSTRSDYVSQFLDDLRKRVEMPMPSFQGNWLQDVVASTFGRSAYTNVYLDAVNSKNIAANVLRHAQVCFDAAKYECALKYGRLALDYLQTSDQQFLLAQEVYQGRVEKVGQTAAVVYRLTSPAVSLVCGDVLPWWACAALVHSVDYAVDYALTGEKPTGTNIAQDAALELVGRYLRVEELQKEAQVWLGQSRVYEKLGEVVRNPNFRGELMSVLATVLNVGLEAVPDIAEHIVDAMMQQLLAPVYIAPTSSGSGGGGGGALSSEQREARAASTNAELGSSELTFAADGIVSAASYKGGGIVPGEVVILFGEFGVGSRVLMGQVDNDGMLGSELEGIRVLFNGIPAPLLYVSDTQIGAVVPYEVTEEQFVQVQLERDGSRWFPVRVPLLIAKPAVFSQTMTGQGPGVVVNQDGSINSPSNPAGKGSTISIYATGSGQTSPPGETGRIAVQTGGEPLLPVRVFMGGVEAEVTYAGGTPGAVAGVLKIDARVPWDAPVGTAIPVRVVVGELSSQEEITITIR